MEKEGRNHYQTRGSSRGGGGGTAAERDLLLQWGNRKRLRCVKVHRRDVEAAEKAAIGQRRAAAAAAAAAQHHPTGHTHHRVLRNSEEFAAMKSPTHQQQNNGIHTVASPDRERPGRGNNNNNGVPQTFPDDKKGSSSGSEGSIWPKFAITLSNREKEEDFLVFKGSKLPQRPKKRAKVIQRTVNFVCPGTWLCDLTLERYEVREKKVSKKRPRGLKAMHDMDSDSE
ncbi:hypothetical protein BAE44_0011152 [Dichanthelium oligosanthes]|uniref:DUF1639 family protein n=1 Tax=Dichanthelium oligosanthes TaxID=888268 RepID=A0A1E5VRU4_9POAL|nr:hypothetical protein BAE44_0011152 [Dichanthelium oligosanthes]